MSTPPAVSPLRICEDLPRVVSSLYLSQCTGVFMCLWIHIFIRLYAVVSLPLPMYLSGSPFLSQIECTYFYLSLWFFVLLGVCSSLVGVKKRQVSLLSGHKARDKVRGSSKQGRSGNPRTPPSLTYVHT